MEQYRLNTILTTNTRTLSERTLDMLSDRRKALHYGLIPYEMNGNGWYLDMSSAARKNIYKPLLKNEHPDLYQLLNIAETQEACAIYIQNTPA